MCIRDRASIARVYTSRAVAPTGAPQAGSAARPAVSGRIGLPARRPTKASHVSDQQPRFREVSARVDFPALDARVLSFWKEHRIFEKSLEGRDDAPVYV